MAEQKEDDFVGKRVNDVGKLAGWANRDILAMVAVFFMVTTGLLLYAYIKQNNDLNARITEEVRKQVNPAVDSKVSTALPKAVEDAVQPMKEGVEQGMQKLDTVLNKVINKE
ncbi:hypothetical protein [Sphingobacterium sp. 2149]|uniref:hypothetical protein n=1 Tax=Sphingobacterium sp. 2149 TaxID=2817763 RepID=UPI00285F2E6B|nr:hypothetical protein [Sphingobacterium sp. 2149]MDR6734159.1 hypothetical protein [Sphingobacterium sp. 2149]